MAFIPFVNAAATRKNDVGQKWIIVLKEKNGCRWAEKIQPYHLVLTN